MSICKVCFHRGDLNTRVCVCVQWVGFAINMLWVHVNSKAIRSLIGLLHRVIRFGPLRPLLVFNYPCSVSFSSCWTWWLPMPIGERGDFSGPLIASFASACQTQMELFITVTSRFILVKREPPEEEGDWGLGTREGWRGSTSDNDMMK